MRAITRCPICQTQFFVSEDQLNKHNGKVRCGQCLHVFDAKTQFVVSNTPAEENLIETASPYTPVEITAETLPITSTEASATKTDTKLNLDSQLEITKSSSSATIQAIDQSMPEWPLINDILDEDDRRNLAALNQTSSDEAAITEKFQRPVTSKDKQAFATENHESNFGDTDTAVHYDEGDHIVDDDGFEGKDEQANTKTISNLNNITKLTLIADNQSNYFDDLANNNKTATHPTNEKSRRWLWLTGAIVLLLVTVGQSIYFLRDDIAIYYPNVKPYLIKACQQLNCKVDLPKQIDLIVIDDSDMQEDINIAALMHFSCSLFNQAPYTQAFPNLELTLTDVEDKPTLRRVFKPNEYLPTSTNVALGFKAGDEIKIKLGITTQGVAVAGYRVFVTY